MFSRLFYQVIILISIYVSINHAKSYELFNSSSEISTIYHCKDSRTCYRFDKKQVLFRSTLTYNGVKQNRWYVENIYSEQRERILGAIELSPEPALVLKQWKRIASDSSTKDEPNIQMRQFNYDCSVSSLITMYQGLLIEVTKQEFSNSLSYCVKLRQVSATGPYYLPNLLKCDYLLLKMSFGKALACMNTNVLAKLNEIVSKYDILEQLLSIHLLWRSIKFQFLVGVNPYVLFTKVSFALELLQSLQSQDRGDKFEVIFYLNKLSQLHSFFRSLFGTLYDTIEVSTPIVPDPKIYTYIEEFQSFVEIELSRWFIANDYFTKLQTVSLMMKQYSERGLDLFPLYASASNYALQSGAIEQAVSMIVAGMESASGPHIILSTEISLSFPQSSLVYYLQRLQFTIYKTHDRWLSDSESFQSVLTILTQAGSPVILSPITQIWWEEVYHARKIMVDTLEVLKDACAAQINICYLNVHHRGAGIRGLFLAAYQGVSLISSLQLSIEGTQCKEIDCYKYVSDSTLPIVYYKLLQSVSHHNPMIDAYSSFSRVVSASEETASRARPISIVFVCYSISRHSVGRLLAKLIRYVVSLRTESGDPQFLVYILTDKRHPNEVQEKPSPSVSSRTQDDEIFLDIASLFTTESKRWLTLPAFDFSPDRLASVFTTIRQLDNGLFDIAVFSDLLMQASQCIWAHTIRIAQYQIVFWGHPQTTGMINTMDYYITSDSFEPTIHSNINVDKHSGFRQSHYSEQLIRFDSLSFVLYEAEPIALSLPHENENIPPSLDYLDISKSKLSRTRFLSWLRNFSESFTPQFSSSNNSIHEDWQSYRLYGSVQTLMKHHPMMDAMLYKLLLHDTQAIVVLLKGSNTQAHWFQRFQLRLYTYFLAQTDDCLEEEKEFIVDQMIHRVRWVASMPHRQYARLICHMDVNLDPFIFGGGVTLCDGMAGSCGDQYGDEDDANSDDDVTIKTPSVAVVGFVTAGALQTVHRIGAGIAHHVNDTSLAIDVTYQKDFTEVSKTANIDEIIEKYVVTAIKQATQAQERWLSKLSFAGDILNKATNNTASANPTNKKKRIDELIYQNKAVFQEYVQLFHRIMR